MIKSINEAEEILILKRKIPSTINESPLNDDLLSQSIAFILEIQQRLYITIGGVTAITKELSLMLIGSVITYSLL